MNNALISDCKQYRYWLCRPFENTYILRETILFIMLNPSTADASVDDPTIRRCMGFAKRLDSNGLTVANLYAYRATKPAELWKCNDPVGPQNNHWLNKLVKGHSNIICA